MGTRHYQLHIGAILDERYVIRSVLGEGGFGITYEAENLHTKAHVAIKEFFCRDFMDRNAESSDEVTVFDKDMLSRFEKEKARFLKEARILRDFNDEEGVVHVIDSFESNGTAYIILTFLEGSTLREHVRSNGRPKPEILFRRIKPLLRALRKIHDAGLIHRDISPDNIMVSPEESFDLIDFGAAYTYNRNTKSYTAICKNGYAAPEQYRSDGSAGPAADIYSLCATLYYCLTGADPVDSLQRILADDLQSPSALGIKIAPEAERILMKGLSLKASDRYQNIEEFSRAIEKVYPDEIDPKQAARKRLLLVCGTALALIAAIATFGFFRWRNNQPVFRLRNVDTEVIHLTPGETAYGENAQSSLLVKERLEALAGENNYLWSETEEDIRMEFPTSLIPKEYSPERFCREFLIQDDAEASSEADVLPFTVLARPLVDWENPENALLPGDFQRSNTEFRDSYHLFMFDANDASSENNAAWIHDLVVFKNRLDAFEVPYAIGSVPYDEGMIAVKTERGAISQYVADTLGESLSGLSETQLIGAGDNGGVISLDLQGARVENDRWIIPFANAWDADRIREWTDLYAGAKDGYYLRALGRAPVATVDWDTLKPFIENSEVVFTKMAFEGKEDSPGSERALLSYLQSASLEDPVNHYRIQYIFCEEKDGCLGNAFGDLSDALFPEQNRLYETVAKGLSDEDAAVEYIPTETYPLANREPVRFVPNPRLTIHCYELSGDHFAARALERAGQIYENYLQDNCMNTVQLFLYRDKKDGKDPSYISMWFTCDSLWGSSMLGRSALIVAPDAEALAEEANAGIAKDPILQPLLREDWAGFLGEPLEES